MRSNIFTIFLPAEYLLRLTTDAHTSGEYYEIANNKAATSPVALPPGSTVTVGSYSVPKYYALASRRGTIQHTLIPAGAFGSSAEGIGVGNVEVKATWFETVSSGTTGTITSTPQGGTVLFGDLGAGVDVIVSTIEGGVPGFALATTSGGTPITATLDSSLNYTLSGTPSAYPVALIYSYKVQLYQFSYAESLTEVEYSAGGLATTINSETGAVTIAGTTNQVNVSTSSGTITLSTPQDLATSSSVEFNGVTVSGETASRLAQFNSSKEIKSLSSLAAYVAGTSNRVTVSDDGDGSITVSAPQDLHTSATPTFAGGTFTGAVSGPTPSSASELATKAYVDGLVQGASWQEAVLDKDLTAPPGSPTAGDRYIVAAVATGAWASEEDSIAEWNGSSWDFIQPYESMMVYVDDEDKYYNYNGTAWVYLGSIIDHGNLIGLLDDDHTQYHTDARALTWLDGVAGAGILVKTATETFSARTISGTTNQVLVSNGNGVSGNPTLSLPQDIHTGATPLFAGLFITSTEGAAQAIFATENSASYSLVSLRNDSYAGLAMFMNGTARTDDGGVNTATIRNDIGALRLLDNTDTGITLTSGTASVGGNLSVAGATTLASSLNGVLKASSGVVSGSSTTSDVPEGSNLYYTTARVDSHLSGGDGITYSSGVISADINTTNLKFTSTEINTIQDISTASSPSFNAITTTGNGGNLSMYGTDHVYMQFFPDASTRRAYIGYGGAGSKTLAIVNEYSGVSEANLFFITEDNIIHYVGGANRHVINAGSASYYVPLSISTDNYLTIGPNSTWSESIAFGGNGNVHSTASVVTTNGNLHLDAKNGAFSTFINFYTGTEGVQFGNGAGSVVGHINSLGNMYITGKLGVGTSSFPASPYNLDIASTGGIYARLNSTGAGQQALWELRDNDYSYFIGKQNNDTFLIYDNTANAERLTITTAGRFGINDISPLCQLSVGGGSVSDSAVKIQLSADGGIGYFGANRTNGAYGALFGWDAGYIGAVIRSVAATDNIAFVVNNTTHAANISPAGLFGIANKVRIGGLAPSGNYMLEIEQSSDNQGLLVSDATYTGSVHVYVDTAGDSIFKEQSGNDIKFITTYGAETLVMPSATGYVGFGVTPAYQIHAVNTNSSTPVAAFAKSTSASHPTYLAGSAVTIIRNGATNNDCYAHIISGTGGVSALTFGDSADADAGGIWWSNPTGSMFFTGAGFTDATLVRAHALEFSVYSTASTKMKFQITSNNNIGMFDTGSFGGGQQVLFLANCVAAPTVSSPTGGGIVYVESGALKYKGSSGTVTTIAVA